MTDLSSDHLDEIMRALAHPDRRAFVQACIEEPKAAGELAEISSLALASVSEHIKVLRKSGLLVLDKQGRFRIYRTDSKLLRATARSILVLDKRGKSGDERNN